MIAPFSGAEYDLAAGQLSFAPEGKRIAKKQPIRMNPLYESLKAVAKKLMALIDSMSGRSNHELKETAKELADVIERHEL